MKVLLILYMFGNNGTITLIHKEFTNRTQCQAVKAIINEQTASTEVYAKCVTVNN